MSSKTLQVPPVRPPSRSPPCGDAVRSELLRHSERRRSRGKAAAMLKLMKWAEGSLEQHEGPQEPTEETKSLWAQTHNSLLSFEHERQSRSSRKAVDSTAAVNARDSIQASESLDGEDHEIVDHILDLYFKDTPEEARDSAFNERKQVGLLRLQGGPDILSTSISSEIGDKPQASEAAVDSPEIVSQFRTISIRSIGCPIPGRKT
ncbi:hypothetical protein ACSSS7_007490 [Eimeria intestinalis]